MRDKAPHIRYFRQSFGVVLICIMLSACQGDEDNALVNGTESRPVESALIPATRILPTIYPTSSPHPTLLPTETISPLPTDIPNTPIAFDQTVVELTYTIPSIGLERSMRANVSSVLEVTDEATGEAVILRDQIGVIYELQLALPELNLEELPEACPNCVQLSYNLPLAGLQDQGWLTDAQMLASLENFTAANIQPHFPEKTVLGYRRSATPYQAAYTLALTSDGALWHWSAIDGEVPNPTDDGEFVDRIGSLVGDLTIEELSDGYSAPCPSGAGLETLYIKLTAESKQIKFVCPELSLPYNLLPLYLELVTKVEEVLPKAIEDEPAKAVPLNNLIHYQTSDGSQMSLLIDGYVNLLDSKGIVYTQTITVSNIISLTAILIDDGNLLKGASIFNDSQTDNLLFVRGFDSVYSIGWSDGEAPLERESMDLIDRLLEELLEQAVLTREGDNDQDDAITPTPAPEETSEP